MARVPPRDRGDPGERRGDRGAHPGPRGRGLGAYPASIADERTEKISALLHEAGEVHHVVYRITDGEDGDWASFYSEWLTDHSELGDLLGKPPVHSHLTHALVECERELGAEQGWEDSYAERLVERFGS